MGQVAAALTTADTGLVQAATSPDSSAPGWSYVEPLDAVQDVSKEDNGSGPPRVGPAPCQGAHLLLQVRTRTLNDDLAATFRTWYPAFSLTDQPAGGSPLAA